MWKGRADPGCIGRGGRRRVESAESVLARSEPVGSGGVGPGDKLDVREWAIRIERARFRLGLETAVEDGGDGEKVPEAQKPPPPISLSLPLTLVTVVTLVDDEAIDAMRLFVEGWWPSRKKLRSVLVAVPLVSPDPEDSDLPRPAREVSRFKAV